MGCPMTCGLRHINGWKLSAMGGEVARAAVPPETAIAPAKRTVFNMGFSIVEPILLRSGRRDAIALSGVRTLAVDSYGRVSRSSRAVEMRARAQRPERSDRLASVNSNPYFRATL